jgi:hypothetical protein
MSSPVDALALLKALTLRIPPPAGSKHHLTLDDDAGELDVTVFVGTRWYRFGLDEGDGDHIGALVERIAGMVDVGFLG